MNTRSRNLTISFLLMIAMLLGVFAITHLTANATGTSPEWVDDYTVEAPCGTANTMLGYFNGSSACIHASTGDLHYCTANFPYSEMQCAVYGLFTGDYLNNSPENVNAKINGSIFMDLDTAHAVTSIDVHTHTLQG